MKIWKSVVTIDKYVQSYSRIKDDLIIKADRHHSVYDNCTNNIKNRYSHAAHNRSPLWPRSRGRYLLSWVAKRDMRLECGYCILDIRYLSWCLYCWNNWESIKENVISDDNIEHDLFSHYKHLLALECS